MNEVYLVMCEDDSYVKCSCGSKVDTVEVGVHRVFFHREDARSYIARKPKEWGLYINTEEVH